MGWAVGGFIYLVPQFLVPGKGSSLWTGTASSWRWGAEAGPQLPVLCALGPRLQTQGSTSTLHSWSPLHKCRWGTLVLITSRNSSLAKHNLDRNIKWRWASEFCITVFTWLLAKIWELQGLHVCLPACLPVCIYICTYIYIYAVYVIFLYLWMVLPN